MPTDGGLLEEFPRSKSIPANASISGTVRVKRPTRSKEGASGTTPILCAGSASRVADEPVRRARAFVYEVDRTGVKNVESFVAGME